MLNIDSIGVQKIKKIGNIAICAFFTCCLFLFIVLFAASRKGGYSVIENRELASFPAIWDGSAVNGNFYVELNSYFCDAFPLRDQFLLMNRKINSAYTALSLPVGDGDEDVAFIAAGRGAAAEGHILAGSLDNETAGAPNSKTAAPYDYAGTDLYDGGGAWAGNEHISSVSVIKKGTETGDAHVKGGSEDYTAAAGGAQSGGPEGSAKGDGVGAGRNGAAIAEAYAGAGVSGDSYKAGVGDGAANAETYADAGEGGDNNQAGVSGDSYKAGVVDEAGVRGEAGVSGDSYKAGVGDEAGRAGVGDEAGDDYEANESTGVSIVSGRTFELFEYSESRTLAYAKIVNEIVARCGVPAYVVLPPSASELYLPERYRKPQNEQKQAFELLAKSLKGAVFVDSSRLFEINKDNYIYFKTDHHWTADGAFLAYVEFAKAAGFVPAYRAEMDRGRIEGFLGSLYRQIYQDGHSELLEKEPDYVQYYWPLYKTEVINYKDAEMTEGVAGEVLRPDEDLGVNQYNVFFGGDTRLLYMRSGVGNGRSVMVVRDSYGHAFLPYLANNYERVYAIEPRYFETFPIADFIAENKIDELLFINHSLLATGKYWMDWVSQLEKLK